MSKLYTHARAVLADGDAVSIERDGSVVLVSAGGLRRALWLVEEIVFADDVYVSANFGASTFNADKELR